ncbi:MAG: CRTAC1 family protein [Acidobacteria bacterium]|nr:MAG: CRTAC1 family protein [Acidobacteriota bacterium]PYU37650.1 MAG: CRTAC1 family protein [Acidobacteriota bacterium]PYU44728.1 MAG: CRTAC1 family protein [Acidobacteriota bacterium]
MSKNLSLQARLSRRDFAKGLGLIGFGGASLAGAAGIFAWSDLTLAQRGARTGSPQAFEQILPSVSGITWVHRNGRSAEMFLPETTGAGCAFFDYDNDGWMDIYLVNSGKCDFYDPRPPLRNALYHNNRNGTFTDVTEKAGVAGGGYGMGVAVGDYNGDGFPDLYVTQYGRSILYRNNGNGTFTDVIEKAGVAAPGWASSAVWFDYDNDGRLDLFVCRFVDFDKSKNKFCGDAKTGDRYYCIPRVYDPAASWLFHNNGDGTFTEVGHLSDIGKSMGKAWGVVAADINNDGWMDLWVANDTVPNFLFANRGKGKFEEIALQAGVGYSTDGRARSGMGVDAADYDQDGWIDLFVTNVDQEMYSFYHNNHDETFDDVAVPTHIGMVTRLMSGWGVKFFDYDNDGNIDLFIANGHPDDKIEERFSDVKYKEPLLLFHNNGKAFENVSARSGEIFADQMAARGLAIGDFNNDGAVDVLVARNNDAPLLLRNNAAKQSHWLGVKLVSKKANPDAIGALIRWQAGDLKRHLYKAGGGSYLASHDPRVVLGIGTKTKLDWVEVKWPLPSGKVERFTNLPIDQYIVLTEGEGAPVKAE